MGEDMDEKRLEELQALADAAEPGPWRALPCDDAPSRCDGIETSRFLEVVKTDSGVYPPDWPTAQFIAAARTAVPELVAEVRRLTAALRRIGTRTNRRDAAHPASISEIASEVRDALGVEQFSKLLLPLD